MNAQTEFDFETRREEVRQASAAMIERIKKLLRLAADKRGNQHEAERAMAMAYELAEKHRVDVASLDLDEATERLIHEHWETGMRFDRLRRGVVGILLSFFHVTVCLQPPRMLVIGKPADVLIAQYVHDFLLRAGRECLRAYELAEKLARRRVTARKRAGYIEGFIWGVTSKLRETHADLHLGDVHEALVVAEKAQREQKLNELVPLERQCEVKALGGGLNEPATMRGYRDGRDTHIHQPLAGTPSGPLLLN